LLAVSTNCSCSVRSKARPCRKTAGIRRMSVYELDWIAGGPPTVRLLSRAMGAERIGIMVAWITVIHQVGGAAAAYLGGALRSGSGTYFEAFMIAGLMCIGAALSVLFIGAGRARREKQTAALPAE